MKPGLVGLFVAAVGLTLAAGSASGMDKFLALGTSSAGGVYYPVGKGLCDLLNRDRKTHRIRCRAAVTGGSIYNLFAIESGELDLGLTRSDLAAEFFAGSGDFADGGPHPDLRAVAGLYDNPAAIIVKADGPIEDFEGIVGTRLNIGNRGSGKRAAADLLQRVMGWTRSDFAEITEFDTDEMGEAFCEGRVDVLIQMMGIPSAFYDMLTVNCGARFLPIPDEVMDRIRRDHPSFSKAVIPGGLYPHNPDPVVTFSTKVVLVVAARIHDITMERFVRRVFGDVEALRETHPVLDGITGEAIPHDGIAIPLHPGARGFYVERGWLK